MLCADLRAPWHAWPTVIQQEARPRLDPVLERMMADIQRLPHAPLHGVIRDIGGGTRPPHISPH